MRQQISAGLVAVDVHRRAGDVLGERLRHGRLAGRLDAGQQVDGLLEFTVGHGARA